MPPRTDEHLACFGKLPIAGDFVRGDREAPELADLDAWIQDGMHRSQMQLGNAWQGRFDALPPSRFLWQSAPGGAVLAGLWRSSVDSAGRRYPFLVALRASGLEPADVAALPIAVEAIATATAPLFETGFAGLDAAGVVRAIRELPCHLDLEAARATLTERAGNTTTGSVSAGDDQVTELLLHDLDDLTSGPPPKYCLRWRTAGNSVDTAFWLQALARVGVAPPRLMLWHDTTDTELPNGCIRTALHEASARMFTGLVFFDADDDNAYDIGRDFDGGERLQQARARYGDAVSRSNQADALAALPGGAG